MKKLPLISFLFVIGFFLLFFKSETSYAFTIFTEPMSGAVGQNWNPLNLKLTTADGGNSTYPIYSLDGITGAHPGDPNYGGNFDFQHFYMPENQQNSHIEWDVFLPTSYPTPHGANAISCLSDGVSNYVTAQFGFYANTLWFNTSQNILNSTPGFHHFEMSCINGNVTVKEDGIVIGTSSYSTIPKYSEVILQVDTATLDEWSNFQYCNASGCGFPSLSVPLLKQTNINWGLQLYDSADQWSPLHSTIAEWGCALTSATMVLQYYNITKLPDGTILDPGTLNTWLKNQPDGYLSDEKDQAGGLVNWLAIARLTHQAKVSGEDPNFTYDALAYLTSGKDDSLLTQDLENNQPDILEEPGHFIVGTGQTSNSFTVNDPYYSRTDLTQGYNNTYLSLGRYIPSHTDLSYVLLVTDPSVSISLTDSNNVSTGSSYLQNPLTGDQDPGLTSGNPIKIFYAPQPHSDTYHLTLTGQPNQPYSVTAYLYDKDGNVTDPITLSGNFDNTGSSSTIVKFDNQSVANDQINPAITFDTLANDISTLQKTNQIQSGTGNALTALAKNASNSSGKKVLIPTKVQLIALQGLLDVFHNRGISDQAYKLLEFDVQYLLNSL